MSRRIIMSRILALTLAAGFAVSAGPAPAKDQWVTLLDSKTKDLSGWDKAGDANWRIENGIAVADKGNGFLVSKKDYKNFRIRAEFWVGPDANSGVFVHATDPKEVTGKNAYEVNIWDERPEKDYATGAVVGVAKVDPMPKTVGKWNVYDITLKDGVFTVKLNGKTTVNGAKDTKLETGRIALQHGLGNKDASGKVNDAGVVKFRKVQIQEL
jgi:hypothetical protein